MVTAIEKAYTKELKNEYMGYNNETPKSILKYLSTEYCKVIITDWPAAIDKFKKPWDQVTNLNKWITLLEVLSHKCDKAHVTIDDEHMMLKITKNSLKCRMFTKEDHEKYDELTTYNLQPLKKFWIKAYKAHTTYIRLKTGANEFEKAAYLSRDWCWRQQHWKR